MYCKVGRVCCLLAVNDKLDGDDTLNTVNII